jgi:hypothetical protein
MIATATVPAPPDAAPKPEEPAQLIVRRLTVMAVYGRPRAALAAFNALTSLDKYYKDTQARMTELSRVGRPAVGAAAVKALVRAHRARRRYRDGRGLPL